jgi:hypothetical protein
MNQSYARRFLSHFALSFLLLATMAGCAQSESGRLGRETVFDPGGDEALILISVSYIPNILASQEAEWRAYDPRTQKLIPGGATFKMRSTHKSIDQGGDLFGFFVDPGHYIMVGIHEAKCTNWCKPRTTMVSTGVMSIPLLPMTRIDVKQLFHPKVEARYVEGILHPAGAIVVPDDASTEESDSWRVSVGAGEIVYLGEYMYLRSKDSWRRTVTDLQSLIEPYEQISGTVVYRPPRQSDDGVTNTQ